MSNKENRILKPNGGRYPFRAPSDEYFENLTARIMERIPDETLTEHVEEQPKAETARLVNINRGERLNQLRTRRRNSLWVSVISIAASLVLIATIALRFLPKPTTVEDQTNELTNEYISDDYNEQLMTYTMADNMDVYYYLSDGGADE